MVKINDTNKSVDKTSLLKIIDDKKYIVTKNNAPFFWLGGTVWELIHHLKKQEIDLYFSESTFFFKCLCFGSMLREFYIIYQSTFYNYTMPVRIMHQNIDVSLILYFKNSIIYINKFDNQNIKEYNFYILYFLKFVI